MEEAKANYLNWQMSPNCLTVGIKYLYIYISVKSRVKTNVYRIIGDINFSIKMYCSSNGGFHSPESAFENRCAYIIINEIENSVISLSFNRGW